MTKLPDYSFTDRTAILTGAASGIGRALAIDLAGRGSHLALVDRDQAGLERLAGDLRGRHPALRISVHEQDLADSDGFGPLVDTIRREHPRIALLINCAGVAMGGDFQDLSVADIDWVMAINFRAPVVLCKAFLPDLLSAPGSHIVNVSSLYGLISPPGQIAYASSKFALRGFTQGLQAELAGTGVGVTLVHPGGVATGIAANARAGSSFSGSAEDAEKRRSRMQALLKMPPEEAAREIAEAVRTRSSRLVITRTARFADRLSRLMPRRHLRVLGWFVKP